MLKVRLRSKVVYSPYINKRRNNLEGGGVQSTPFPILFSLFPKQLEIVRNSGNSLTYSLKETYA